MSKMDTSVYGRPAKDEWYFKSKSHPGTVYTTRLNENGFLSCNCPGWTRRKKPDGTRECSHTKQVMKEEHITKKGQKRFY